MKKITRNILEEIRALFEQAKGATETSAAKRYVHKARVLAMKHRTRLPPALKRQFCKHCGTLFRQGKNVRIRTTKGKVVYTCLDCKKHMRFRYR